MLDPKLDPDPKPTKNNHSGSITLTVITVCTGIVKVVWWCEFLPFEMLCDLVSSCMRTFLDICLTFGDMKAYRPRCCVTW